MRNFMLLSGVVVLAVSAAYAEPPPSDLPRRMLIVQVHHYLYLDPLAAAPSAKNQAAIDGLAATLHVPTWKTNNQLFILSDSIPLPSLRTPTKAAIAAGVRQFCDTCRVQDRVMLYFHGHAFERDGKAYFAPIDGEPGDTATLVPVADIYDWLKACRATQKLVVWDVCPRNPDRDPIRPRSGPLTLELFLAFMKVPAGSDIQAVISCVPNEFSLESASPKGDGGSILFEAMRKAFEDVPEARRSDAAAAIPIVEAFPALEKQVEAAAAALGAKQSPKLFGNLPPALTAVKPGEPLASGVHFSGQRLESAAEVKAILDELKLPPLVPGTDPLPMLSFDSSALKAYLPDAPIEDIFRESDKYPLRVAVLRALQTIRDTTAMMGARDARPIAAITAPITDDFKKKVLDVQAPMAVSIAKLEGEIMALEGVEKFREKENKRWQANYQYATGQLRLRLALLNEYNLALGNIRTETLPELPASATGWRLRPFDKMSSRKEIQELADSAHIAFEANIKVDKGTPWEVLSKRAAATLCGLRWEPVMGK